MSLRKQMHLLLCRCLLLWIGILGMLANTHNQLRWIFQQGLKRLGARGMTMGCCGHLSLLKDLLEKESLVSKFNLNGHYFTQPIWEKTSLRKLLMLRTCCSNHSGNSLYLNVTFLPVSRFDANTFFPIRRTLYISPFTSITSPTL